MASVTIPAGQNTLVMRANPLRKYFLIANTGANQANLALGQAATATGDIPVLANGNFEKPHEFDWKGDIYAYSGSGTTLMFCEM